LDYNKKMKKYIHENGLEAQHLEFSESCHTVEDAVKAVNGSVNEFVKNICMTGENGQFFVAIVKASTSRVGKALNRPRPRLANEEEILKVTGYPAGGVPSFGFDAVFLIDPKVLELTNVYTGGGSPNSLIKISVTELLKANKGTVVRIRK
jgi:Cys-tRNA(Pro)/Cys-tRNA(Cys) deacylase